VSAEVGVGLNRASDYQETPLLEANVPMAPFTNHNKTSLAWGCGLGADWDIKPSAPSTHDLRID